MEGNDIVKQEKICFFQDKVVYTINILLKFYNLFLSISMIWNKKKLGLESYRS